VDRGVPGLAVGRLPRAEGFLVIDADGDQQAGGQGGRGGERAPAAEAAVDDGPHPAGRRAGVPGLDIGGLLAVAARRRAASPRRRPRSGRCAPPTSRSWAGGSSPWTADQTVSADGQLCGSGGASAVAKAARSRACCGSSWLIDAPLFRATKGAGSSKFKGTASGTLGFKEVTLRTPGLPHPGGETITPPPGRVCAMLRGSSDRLRSSSRRSRDRFSARCSAPILQNIRPPAVRGGLFFLFLIQLWIPLSPRQPRRSAIPGRRGSRPSCRSSP